MRDFVALDVETANHKPTSICSIGVVRVEGGAITGRAYHLVRPTPNYYLESLSSIHGLSAQDTDGAERFPEVWSALLPFLGELPFVAHNAPFDSRCLCATLEYYKLPASGSPFYCTLAAARRRFGRTLPNHRLPTVASACGYVIEEHHHALADAEACAHIAMAIL